MAIGGIKTSWKTRYCPHLQNTTRLGLTSIASWSIWKVLDDADRDFYSAFLVPSTEDDQSGWQRQGATKS